MVDLDSETYSDADLWRPDWTQAAAQFGYNLFKVGVTQLGGGSGLSSSGTAGGGMLVRNDVKGGAFATIRSSEVASAGVFDGYSAGYEHVASDTSADMKLGDRVKVGNKFIVGWRSTPIRLI